MIVKMDLHTHTKFSDGRNTVIDNIRSAEACGLEILGITDHVFRAEDFIWLDDLRNIIRKTNSSVKVLAGAEVHIKKDGTLPLSSDSLSKLDIVIGELYVPKEWNSSLTRMEFLEIVGESIKNLPRTSLLILLRIHYI
ncbi:MAG: PHP domain-containing protein [Thermoproteales archaeon]|nr:PHP domain-containing protein [Thermoproteales archaeon]